MEQVQRLIGRAAASNGLLVLLDEGHDPDGPAAADRAGSPLAR
jgi:hypothetical protein